MLELLIQSVAIGFKGKYRSDIGIVVALIFHKDHLVQFIVDLFGLPDAGGVLVLDDQGPVNIVFIGFPIEIAAVMVRIGIHARNFS